jgi:hypothetical protein
MVGTGGGSASQEGPAETCQETLNRYALCNRGHPRQTVGKGVAMSEGDRISVQDAIRLKHEINKSIKHGGYSTQEIRELERLNDREHTELAESIKAISKAWFVFPNWVMWGGFLLAGAAALYVESSAGRVVLALTAIFCVGQGAYRLGVYYGFMRGFQEGHENGVHRVLGISSEDAAEIKDRAIEMEMDERLIQNLDKHSDRPASS